MEGGGVICASKAQHGREPISECMLNTSDQKNSFNKTTQKR